MAHKRFVSLEYVDRGVGAMHLVITLENETPEDDGQCWLRESRSSVDVMTKEEYDEIYNQAGTDAINWDAEFVCKVTWEDIIGEPEPDDSQTEPPISLSEFEVNPNPIRDGREE